VVDEACKNPKQIKTKEDEDHFTTSNHTDSKKETNEGPEEEIMIE